MNAVEAGGLMRTLRLYMETIPGLDQAATIDRLLTRAQLDPDVSKHLLSAPVDPQQHTRWNTQLFRLIGVAEAGRESGRDSIVRSEEHTYELQSLMRTSYAVFSLKKTNST